MLKAEFGKLPHYTLFCKLPSCSKLWQCLGKSSHQHSLRQSFKDVTR